MMKKLLLITFLGLLSLTNGGEYHSIIIRGENYKCCECECEYNPMEDAKWFDEELSVRYKYFGGAPHICIGTHCRDEKGADLSVKHKPHICRGE